MKMLFSYFRTTNCTLSSADALNVSTRLAGEVGLEHESLGDGVVGENLVVIASLLNKQNHPLLLVCLTEAVSKKKTNHKTFLKIQFITGVFHELFLIYFLKI